MDQRSSKKPDFPASPGRTTSDSAGTNTLSSPRPGASSSASSCWDVDSEGRGTPKAIPAISDRAAARIREALRNIRPSVGGEDSEGLASGGGVATAAAAATTSSSPRKEEGELSIDDDISIIREEEDVVVIKEAPRKHRVRSWKSRKEQVEEQARRSLGKSAKTESAKKVEDKPYPVSRPSSPIKRPSLDKRIARAHRNDSLTSPHTHLHTMI